MAVTTVQIDPGAAPNDGTGDPARTGAQSYNTSIANLDAAVEELQSSNWEIDDTSETLALGEKVIAQSHAGITKTLPAAAALSTAGFNDIFVLNVDTNSDVSIDPNGTEVIYYEGASLGAGVAYTLLPQEMAILTYRSAGAWNLYRFRIGDIAVNDLDDVTITSIGTGEVLVWNGSAFINQTYEEADIVERDAAAFENTPYMIHDTRAARASGTETITCVDDPSVYLPISGNNVTIHLDTPALTLPERGLADVRLQGTVDVVMNGNYSGLTVTTDAGTKLGTFPKGTAPSTSGERAVLVWRYFDDGTTDFMWAEWIPDA